MKQKFQIGDEVNGKNKELQKERDELFCLCKDFNMAMINSMDMEHYYQNIKVKHAKLIEKLKQEKIK